MKKLCNMGFRILVIFSLLLLFLLPSVAEETSDLPQEASGEVSVKGADEVVESEGVQIDPEVMDEPTESGEYDEGLAGDVPTERVDSGNDNLELLGGSGFDSDYEYLPKPETPKSSIHTNGELSAGTYSGSLNYYYPIEVPKGTNSLSPSVALIYNSHSATSPPTVAGLSWDLSLSYIERDVNYTPQNLSDDSFTLNLGGSSQDLINVFSGEFKTEIESHSKINQRNTSENDGGKTWVVVTTDGTRYTFGNDSNSEAVSERGYTWRWYLNQIEDTSGNKIFYNYTENPSQGDIGTTYLLSIKYNNDRTREISFDYENRPDVRGIYTQGSKVNRTQRLNEITVYYNSTVVRTYEISYTITPHNESSLLESITLYGSENSSLPPVTFDYYGEIVGWFENSSWAPPTKFAKNLGSNTIDLGVRLADVNGDGLIDIIRGYSDSSGSTYEAWINNGSTWDHITEMQQSLKGMTNNVNSLQKSLENPNLNPSTREYLESYVEKGKEKIDDMKEALGE